MDRQHTRKTWQMLLTLYSVLALACLGFILPNNELAAGCSRNFVSIAAERFLFIYKR
ncbi:hypothetical protein MUN89_18405 [Halobacillus salinarum]|uniref:Lipoprotein n=1 Tax=Halobacillus salinarum TaxID=2932257 RepID=A0ABY4EIF2_9BACI|nr:hypothetical protein [Halobacillus salinarum]UOQ43828.1 hypothetical protein MUN89_18405 [Halobacillus salinarum]